MNDLLKKRNDDIWRYVLDDLALYYPDLANRCVYWYPSGHDCITIKLENGEKYEYEHGLNIIRKIQTYESDPLDIEDGEWSNIFASNIRRRMSMCCINQERICELTGISSVSMSKYMNGKAIPSTRNLCKIAKALKCSASELVNF